MEKITLNPSIKSSVANTFYSKHHSKGNNLGRVQIGLRVFGDILVSSSTIHYLIDIGIPNRY